MVGLRTSSAPLLDWLAGTGCSKVAVHFDIDAIDAHEIVLGLGAEPDGLTAASSSASLPTSATRPTSSP